MLPDWTASATFRPSKSCDHQHRSAHLDPGGEGGRRRLGALSAALRRLQLLGQLPGLGGQLRRLLCLVARVPPRCRQLRPQLRRSLLSGILLSLLAAKEPQLCSSPTGARCPGIQQCNRRGLFVCFFGNAIANTRKNATQHLAQAVTDRA